MYSRKLIIFLFFILILISNKSFAQIFIQPQGGAIWNKSKVVKSIPYLVNFFDSQPYFGLTVGKRKNKIEQSLSYAYYPIGVDFLIKNFPYYAYGWGTKYMDTHNISYDFSYNVLHWKRLDVKTGLSARLCTSKSTWPSTKVGGGSTVNYDSLEIIGQYNATAYERTQLLFEPHIDIDIRLAKRIAWTTHWGYIFGNKNIYILESKYVINGVQQPAASVKVDGTAVPITMGFKFYFKQKKPKE